MSAAILVFAAAAIFGIGAYGLLISRHVMRKLLALNLMLSAVFLLLIVVPAPIGGQPDPVPQALVLTGIVIAVSTTAFALALMVRLFGKQGHASIPSDLDPRVWRGRWRNSRDGPDPERNGAGAASGDKP
ncbi:MAG: NADH-quinone oxidoreductase subunit K [Wenzhouxiangellaceae bacterium]|nr:NADH-quinone oxidoreductase subunit K [Wenzhouxiangellaceae bacterium]